MSNFSGLIAIEQLIEWHFREPAFQTEHLTIEDKSEIEKHIKAININTDARILIVQLATETSESMFGFPVKLKVANISVNMKCGDNNLQLIGAICYHARPSHYNVIVPDHTTCVKAFIEIDDIAPSRKALKRQFALVNSLVYKVI